LRVLALRHQRDRCDRAVSYARRVGLTVARPVPTQSRRRYRVHRTPARIS